MVFVHFVLIAACFYFTALYCCFRVHDNASRPLDEHGKFV